MILPMYECMKIYVCMYECMYVGMYMLMMLKPTKIMSLCPLPAIAARRTAAVPPSRPPYRRPEGGRRAAAVPLPPVAARRAAAAARRAAAAFFLRFCRITCLKRWAFLRLCTGKVLQTRGVVTQSWVTTKVPVRKL